jgi:hypothetical protein
VQFSVHSQKESERGGSVKMRAHDRNPNGIGVTRGETENRESIQPGVMMTGKE